MDLAYIKKVIRLVEKSEVDEIEIEEDGKKIRVARHRNSQVGFSPQSVYAVPSPVIQSAAPAVPLPVPKPEKKYHEVKSPIVGTFYRAPAPDAANYVEIGQDVNVGSVLCIVEAMKLMNEIESDLEGRVVQILAENGKPVEYNQVLFLIDPS